MLTKLHTFIKAYAKKNILHTFKWLSVLRMGDLTVGMDIKRNNICNKSRTLRRLIMMMCHELSIINSTLCP